MLTYFTYNYLYPAYIKLGDKIYNKEKNTFLDLPKMFFSI